MKKTIAWLTLMATPVFAASVNSAMTMVAKPLPANTIAKQYSSSKDHPGTFKGRKRLTDYPTQIVRMEAELKGDQPLICDQVFEQVDAFFTDHITYDKFFYNTINYCMYDPATGYAKKFMINSYFDPISDEGIKYLQKYLAEHNGRNLLGSPFYVENAKGLVVSLNIDVGNEDFEDTNTLLRFQHDNASLYFTSHYAMLEDLLTDIQYRFYSNNPDVILPFIDKWFKTSIWRYQNVLQKSNYVELQPELIFLMDKDPVIFSPYLRMYYAHHCSQYENKRCLRD